MREGQPNLLLPKQTAEYMVAKPFAQPLLWISFILYLILAAIGIAHHEMWGDEIHSWNIAKGSYHFSELISNSRYEGHPPVWYIILWCISKFTHDPLYVQIIHILIAGMSAFIILFYSPFPLLTRILMPFGYFFLFEYAIISRNYAVGVLLTLCICIVLYRNFRYKIVLYFTTHDHNFRKTVFFSIINGAIPVARYQMMARSNRNAMSEKIKYE